jgi:uncharacterized protein (TIRG00374 family)
VKYFRFIGVVVGASLLGYLLYRVGLARLWQSLRLLGWGYVLVLAAGFLWEFINTIGFQASLTEPVKIPLARLFRIRLIGETFNALLPSGYIAGEPLKVKFLCIDMPFHEASTGVLVAKVAQSLSLVFYLVLGLTLTRPDSPSLLRDRGILISVSLLAVGIIIFTFLIFRGSFSQASNVMHSLTRHPWFKRQEERFLALDHSLREFFRHEKMQFLKSFLWHGAGWFVSAMEVTLILFLLGHPISWQKALFMAALAQLGTSAAVAIPEGVGFYEGGHYLAASLLGLPPLLGVSVALIRRVREFFWHAIGLVMFWSLSKELTKTQTPTASGTVPTVLPTNG